LRTKEKRSDKLKGYLLIESPTPSKVQVISATPKKAKFVAILQTFNEQNRNNRIYKEQDAVESLREIDPKIKDFTFGGELDHPIPTDDEQYTWTRHTTFLYKEAAFMIRSYKISNHKLIAECETVSTPNGYILAGLLKDGVNVGFSARAISDNVEKQGDVEVVLPPITYIAFDCVSNPSHAGAKLMEIKNLESTEIPSCSNGVCMISEHIKHVKTVRYSELNKLFKSGNIRL